MEKLEKPEYIDIDSIMEMLLIVASIADSGTPEQNMKLHASVRELADSITNHVKTLQTTLDFSIEALDSALHF